MTTPSPFADVRLNDGTALAASGCGMSGIWDDAAGAAVLAAARAGYRLVDTASRYGNEPGVGRGLRAAKDEGLDVAVTTKLWNTEHGRDKALRACERSRKALGVDRIDLYLIHWPLPSVGAYVETWRTLVRLREEGQVRSIGVSNFGRDHVERLLRETGVVPAVNQIEVHPDFQQVHRFPGTQPKGSSRRLGAHSGPAPRSTGPSSATSPSSTAWNRPR